MFDEVIDQGRKIIGHQGMMNHLNGIKIVWGNLVSVHVLTLYAQIVLMGHCTILLKDGGVRKLFLCSRWGMKFSLILRNHPRPWLVPRIKSDHSLKKS